MYCIVLALATFRQRLVCNPRLKGVLSHDPAVWSGLSIQKPSMSSPHSPPDLGIGGVVYKYVARGQKLYPVITSSSEPFADHGSPVRQTTSQKSNWPLSITSAELPVSVSRQFFLLPTHPSLPGSGASLGARSFPEIRGKWGHLSAPFEFWGRTSPGQVVVIRLFFFFPITITIIRPSPVASFRMVQILILSRHYKRTSTLNTRAENATTAY